MKKKNLSLIILLMLVLSSAPGWSQKTDTTKQSNPAADQASPGAGPGGRDLLQDTGGKSGLSGKSDTGRSINDQSTGRPVKDRKTNDKYFSIGAAILIGIVMIALIVRYQRRS